MKYLILLVTMITFNSYSSTIKESTGTITKLRAGSTYHESYIASQSAPEVIFSLSSGHAGCAWLGVKNEDKTFISTLLSAQAQGNSVRVWYYTDKKSSVWSSVCQAITIEVE